MPFAELGLSEPLLNAIADKGYSTPSPIQAEAIPAVLRGHDVMAAAQTGTGKTAGFTLPILELLSRGKKASANHTRVLVLTPTRELAAQVGESVASYGKYLDLRSAIVFGGVKINPQMMRLRAGVDVLVATPGRLLDLYQQNAIKFDQLEMLVLDEADRMLDMGFIHDIRKILALLPKKRQNLLFSATFSQDIRELARGIVKQPVEISVSPANRPAASVKQWLYPVDVKQKSLLLMELIRKDNWQQVLVFTKTKRGANRLAAELNANDLHAAAIHGNKSQGARTAALAGFKQGEIRILVATDIAARGLDIAQLPQVVNYELPNVAEDYVHRIGRTGRAGREGQAISLVCADEFKLLVAIENLTGQLLQRESIDGFKAKSPLPESRLGRRAPKKTKPRVSAKDGDKAGNKAGNNRRSKPRRNNAGKATGGNARRNDSATPSHLTGTSPKGTSQSSKSKPSAQRRTSAQGQKPAKSGGRYGKKATTSPSVYANEHSYLQRHGNTIEPGPKSSRNSQAISSNTQRPGKTNRDTDINRPRTQTRPAADELHNNDGQAKKRRRKRKPANGQAKPAQETTTNLT